MLRRWALEDVVPLRARIGRAGHTAYRSPHNPQWQEMNNRQLRTETRSGYGRVDATWP